MSVTTEALENFIVDKQSDLEKIKTSISAFNIFNVLGVQYREIRHSNFLGWLFDPNESHQLGDLFLKELFKLLRKINGSMLNSEQLVHLLLQDLSGTKVYRETKKNIDILIVNKEHDIVICIENKINADFSLDQLRKYYEFVEENYAYISQRLYLTLTPKETFHHKLFEAGENYYNLNYGHILDVLLSNLHIINNSNPLIKASINQYITMTQKDITGTSPEVKLAQEIYSKYKNEIDFIVSTKPKIRESKKAMEDLIKSGKLHGFSISYNSSSSVIIDVLPDDTRIRNLFKKPEFGSWGNNENGIMFSIEIFFEHEFIYLKWVFGDIMIGANTDRCQQIKNDWYLKMKQFECFKNPELKKGKLFNTKPSAKFPTVYTIELLNRDDLLASSSDISELFVKRFRELDKILITPWVNECKEKL